MILSSIPAAAIWFFIFAMPGIMPIRPLMPPIFAICSNCSRMSLRSNWPLRIRSAVRAAFSASILAAARLDQRHHVAHAEDAPGNAARMEIFQRVGLFAGADQLDRLAGDRAHRQRRAAAAVAVDPRQHDAGQADALVERAREVDRVLAGQAVGDQQHFMRIGRGFDLGRFRHHLFVERGAAGGVEQHHVVAAELGGFQRALARSAPAFGRRRSASVGMSRSRPSTANCSIAAGR